MNEYKSHELLNEIIEEKKTFVCDKCKKKIEVFKIDLENEKFAAKVLDYLINDKKIDFEPPEIILKPDKLFEKVELYYGVAVSREIIDNENKMMDIFAYCFNKLAREIVNNKFNDDLKVPRDAFENVEFNLPHYALSHNFHDKGKLLFTLFAYRLSDVQYQVYEETCEVFIKMTFQLKHSKERLFEKMIFVECVNKTIRNFMSNIRN